MLEAADGTFENNPFLYINCQLRKHFHFNSQELAAMDDHEWATHFAILQNIREKEAEANRNG